MQKLTLKNVLGETTKEFKKKKAQRKDRRLKRKEASTPEARLDWKNLPLRHKEEIIVNWNMDGGVISGKRFTKVELAEALGITYGKLEDHLALVQTTAVRAFLKNGAVRDQIFTIISRLGNQIQADRGRAVLHADILEKELQKVLIEIEKAEQLPDETSIDRRFKAAQLHNLRGHFRSMSYQKIETQRVLLESTDANIKFLALFAGSGKEKGSKLFPDEDPGPQEQAEYIDHKEAIKLLEEKQTEILPAQNFGKMGRSPRNPSKGFEEFKEPGSK